MNPGGEAMDRPQRIRPHTSGYLNHGGNGERRVAHPPPPESGTFLRADAPHALDESPVLRSRAPNWYPRWRVAASPIPMLIFLRSSGAIVAANDAAARAYGWTHGELLESSISDLVVWNDLVDRQLGRHHPETKWTAPVLHRRKDGTTFLAELGLLEAGVTGAATMAVVVRVPAQAALEGEA